jgi:hypothetical protein
VSAKNDCTLLPPGILLFHIQSNLKILSWYNLTY